VNYKDLLKDERWQTKRVEVFARDDYRCQNCGYESPKPYLDIGKTINLQAHHNWYERGREPWDYPLDCFLTLCADCHEAETFYRRELEEDLLDSLRRKGFLGSDISRMVQDLRRPQKRDWRVRLQRRKDLEERYGKGIGELPE